jgi:hypothetical protein
MMQKVRCANPNCRRPFVPNPHVKNQRYCGKEECRRLRRNRWQSEKLKSDPEYRKNQVESQQCWMEQNREYWRNYRAQNPAYVMRNRLLQRGRDHRRRAHLAKMDSSNPIYPVSPGSYYLIPAKGGLAKMNSLSPKYFLFPKGYPFLAKKDSIDGMSFPSLGCASKKEAATHDGENHPLPRPGP